MVVERYKKCEDFIVNIIVEFLKYYFNIFFIIENLLMFDNIGYCIYLDWEILCEIVKSL